MNKSIRFQLFDNESEKPDLYTVERNSSGGGDYVLLTDNYLCGIREVRFSSLVDALRFRGAKVTIELKEQEKTDGQIFAVCVHNLVTSTPVDKYISDQVGKLIDSISAIKKKLGC